MWLDTRQKDCPADPFEDEKKYPGVAIGARGRPIGNGKILPIGSYYGEASGIVGLRLFTNPDFDEKAAKRWDPNKYYTDPSYYNDPNLVRPYRVGMSCGFCHVGPSPIHPPADPAHPQWADLNSTVGAQYLWLDRVFSYDPDLASGDSNFFDQLLTTYKPGTMDTSLVSTDYINNPRTMNAVYNLLPRLTLSHRWGREILKGDELDNKQLQGFFDPPDTSWSPRVLKDGSDSVGVLGALNRVYINIGVFSEEWLTHFIPFFGGKPISNIQIPVAEKNSAYWQATEAGTGFMASFLVKAGQPDLLKDAPGGTKFLTTDPTVLQHGKTVFADTCARCHSSKLPEPAKGLDPAGCSGPGYLDCWKQYWAWTKTDDFKSQIRKIVLAPDFVERELPFQRSSRPGDAAPNERLQPARYQRDCRQYLERFFFLDLQSAAVGRHGNGPGSFHRQEDTVPNAGGRPRLHPCAVIDQHLVHSAPAAQQQARAVLYRSLGRDQDEWVPNLDRATALAGEAAARHAAHGRSVGRHHRQDNGTELDQGPGRVCVAGVALAYREPA